MSEVHARMLLRRRREGSRSTHALTMMVLRRRREGSRSTHAPTLMHRVGPFAHAQAATTALIVASLAIVGESASDESDASNLIVAQTPSQNVPGLCYSLLKDDGNDDFSHCGCVAACAAMNANSVCVRDEEEVRRVEGGDGRPRRAVSRNATSPPRVARCRGRCRAFCVSPP